MSPRPSSLSAVLAVVAATVVAAPATAATPSISVTPKPVATSLSTKASKTTITVKNGAKRRATGLTLSVTAAKGVKVVLSGAKRGKLSRKLKPLKAGKAVRVGVSLRRTGSKGPRSGSLAVKVTRKGKTVARGRLAFGATTPAAPAPDPNSLAGRYFWGSG